MSSTGEQQDLLTFKEALEALKTTRATFNRWLKAGKVLGMKVGRQWRFERAEINRFLGGGAPQAVSTVGLPGLREKLRGRFREATGAEFGGEDDVAGLADLTMDLAAHLRAGDIHIDPRADADPGCGESAEALIRFRIDGVLQPIVAFDLRLLPAVVRAWKAKAGCDVRERLRPQDGRIVARLGAAEKSEYDIRVCFLPADLGECLTARLLSKAAVSLDLARLGLGAASLEKIRGALSAPRGLLIVTGPTGSGKTTTQYCCLNEIVRPEIKVMSLEDPVEFHIPGVVQVPVRAEEGVTFASVFRYVMRSDPDVIYVGEIRDRQTMDICCAASMTGHLVLTTLHTRTTIEALQRMADLGVAPFVIAESVSLVLAQRIVRRLCPDCSEPKEQSAEMREKSREALGDSGLDWSSLPDGFRRPVGCPRCVGGFRGRLAIAEVLAVVGDLNDAIRRGAPTAEIQRIAVRQGMITLAADGMRNAAEGRTTIEEVLRVL